MSAVYLVSCTKSKRAQACAARELYAASDWFAKARAYVEAHGAPWFILSAEHGLLAPDQVVAPYETTLYSMAKPARLAWAARVRAAIADRGLGAARFVILAGERYRENLEAELGAEVPMRGLQLGQQKAWLLANTPRAA